MRTLFNRLLYLFRRSRHDADLREEMETHRSLRQEKLEREGAAPDDADQASRRAFGNVTLAREDARGVWIGPAIESLWQDVRGGLRLLRKKPGFAAAVITTLGLGIGGTTAIFSVVDGLFLRAPIGVREPDSLRKVFIKRDAGSMGTPDGGAGSWLDYRAMRERTPAFVGIAAHAYPSRISLGRGATADQVWANIVSYDFLHVLGVRPILGRLFVAEEDGALEAHPVAVISHAMWLARFGGAEDVVGRTLLLNGRQLQIVGVTEAGFIGIGAERIDVWVPSAMAGALHLAGSARDGDWRDLPMIGINYVARLAPGADDDVAAMQASAALALAAEAEPSLDPTPEVLMVPLAVATRPTVSSAMHLWLWLALVAGLVLTVACANVANLLIARATTRRREIAVRMALGAGRRRVVRQHLIESTVLAVLGGVAGLLLANVVIALLRQFPLPPSAGQLDVRLLAFAFAVSVATGIVCGVLPALHAARLDPVRGLKDRAAGGRRSARTQPVLVALQIALSVLLLVGAGLFVRSLWQVNGIESGVDVDRLLVADVDLRLTNYQSSEREAFFDLVVQRLAATPGVERAAMVHFEPFAYLAPAPWIPPGGSTSDLQMAFLNLAGAGYFETAGTRLLQGRSIDASDVRGSERVAVVNEKLANAIAQGGNVVGLCVPFNNQVRAGGCSRIVGVVETQRWWYLRDETQPMVFFARAQVPDIMPWGAPKIVVRTHGRPVDYAPTVRGVLQGLRADLPYVNVAPLVDSLQRERLPFQLGAILFGLFGTVALMLSAVGLYGVLGGFVTDRTAEIGIRRSLGASTASVVGLVTRQGLVPVGVGLAAGLVIAFAGTRYIASLLYGIEPTDASSFGIAVLFLVCVAAASMLLPAWRAARVEPTVALRSE